MPFWEKKKLNNVEEYVAKVCRQRIKDGDNVFSYDESGNKVELDEMSMMLMVIDIFYSALDQCTQEWRKPFHVDVIEVKDKLKEYETKWWPIAEQLEKVQEDDHKEGLYTDQDIVESMKKIDRILTFVERPSIVSPIRQSEWHKTWVFNLSEWGIKLVGEVDQNALAALQYDDQFVDQTERQITPFNDPNLPRKRKRLTIWWIIEE